MPLITEEEQAPWLDASAWRLISARHAHAAPVPPAMAMAMAVCGFTCLPLCFPFKAQLLLPSIAAVYSAVCAGYLSSFSALFNCASDGVFRKTSPLMRPLSRIMIALQCCGCSAQCLACSSSHTSMLLCSYFEKLLFCTRSRKTLCRFWNDLATRKFENFFGILWINTLLTMVNEQGCAEFFSREVEHGIRNGRA